MKIYEVTFHLRRHHHGVMKPEGAIERWWQRDENLGPTGIVGPRKWQTRMLQSTFLVILGLDQSADGWRCTQRLRLHRAPSMGDRAVASALDNRHGSADSAGRATGQEHCFLLLGEDRCRGPRLGPQSGRGRGCRRDVPSAANLGGRRPLCTLSSSTTARSRDGERSNARYR